ncbi:MAG: carboxymuconolactone decarboxylase family protein [Acidiphilium sp.]|nr:carboxymuconolactone decarboxylase family protein [Acidiphilium sp.]MDD4935987.1 carboxymuconolactone decarboxylase family protein [Acidiphilium sp.]
MIEDWKAVIGTMDQGVRDLRDVTPEVMKAFGTLAKSAHGGTALDAKTKELIALAIGVATRCQPCIAYHARDAARAGATRAEIAETLGMAIYMGAGPSAMYAAEALEAFDQASK